MSKRYEWEEAKSDDTIGKVTLGTVAIAILGVAANQFLKGDNDKVRAQIDRKTDQKRALEAKFFKSSAEKEEIARLKREISDLKRKLK